MQPTVEVVEDRAPEVDATSPEAPSNASPDAVTFGATDVRGALSREVVVEAMRPHRDDLRACVERKGTMTARFVVTSEGTVASSTTQASTIPPSDADCVNGVLMQLTLPEPRGGGIVMVLQELSFEEP